MKMRAFARRNIKEILRDPLTLGFGIGFPIILLLLLSLIQSNVPVELFTIGKLAPGVAVFGYSFLALFSALLIAKDRSSALMMRLMTSPLTAADFILGYTLPLVPMAVLQSVACFLFAFVFGLRPSANLLLTLLVLLPAAVVYIAIGLMCGSVLNDKQVGGVCGAVLTNVSAWLSGTWFDLKLVGGAFETVARLLPFANAVDAARASLAGDWAGVVKPLCIVSGYALVLSVLAVRLFAKRMRRT